ncbi:MAG: hypothetical protein ABIH84_02165 [bacterium]
MFRKVTRLEFLAIEAFFAFVRAVRTDNWISGIETGPAARGKPQDGDDRIVTVWQGSKNSLHQRLEIHFFYLEEEGGWNIQGMIFAGRTINGKGAITDWSQAFRGGPSIRDGFTWRFVPMNYDGQYFRDIKDPEEFERIYKKYFCRK